MNEVVELYLDDIIPNRFQPREVFNEDALNELAQSVKEHGIIQPIIVRKLADKYEIIAGERRYKASVLAGLTKIPAIIRNMDDKEASKVALLENLQRKDLSPIEEARTYQKILELDNMTQEELGKTMGKSQSAIANKMRLLSLPDEVQEALLNEKISERHARSLLNLNTSEEQINMLNNIISNRMTVREVDEKVREINGLPPLTQEKTNIVSEDGAKVEVETKDINEPEDLFDYDFSILEDDKEEPIENTKEKVEDELNKIDFLLKRTKAYTLKDGIADIKNIVSKIESKGLSIRVDEMDFERSYQIVIKIDKDK